MGTCSDGSQSSLIGHPDPNIEAKDLRPRRISLEEEPLHAERPKCCSLHPNKPPKNSSWSLWGKFSCFNEEKQEGPWKIHYPQRRLKSVGSQQLDADWEPFNLWTILGGGLKIQHIGNGYSVCNHVCLHLKQIVSCHQSPSFLNECFLLNREIKNNNTVT